MHTTIGTGSNYCMPIKMTMNREEFILELINALNIQKEENNFVNPKQYTPTEIYQTLCFDFPDIQKEQITIISNALCNIPSTLSGCSLINRKFIENIIFLSTSNKEEIKEEMALLCASLFIQVPLKLLDCSWVQANQYLSQISTGPLTNEWEVILTDFKQLCLTCLLSMITDAGMKPMQSKGIVSNLIELITRLNPDHSLKSSYNPNILQSNIYNKYNQDPDISPQHPTTISSKDMKEIWIHYCLLARDLFSHFSDLVPIFMPSLLTSLTSSNNNISLRSNQFPIDSECLLVLISCGISSTIASSLTNPKTSSAEQLSLLLTLRAMITAIEPSMTTIVTILSRMLQYGNPKETAILIYDFALPYLLVHDPSGYQATDQLYHQLLSTQLLPLLTKSYIILSSPSTASSSRSQSSSSPTTTTATATATPDVLSDPLSGTEAIRLAHCLSLVSAAGHRLTSYLWHYPNFITTITSSNTSTMASGDNFQSVSENTDGNPQYSNVALSRLPLLLALSLSLSSSLSSRQDIDMMADHSYFYSDHIHNALKNTLLQAMHCLEFALENNMNTILANDKDDDHEDNEPDTTTITTITTTTSTDSSSHTVNSSSENQFNISTSSSSKNKTSSKSDKTHARKTERFLSLLSEVLINLATTPLFVKMFSDIVLNTQKNNEETGIPYKLFSDFINTIDSLISSKMRNISDYNNNTNNRMVVGEAGEVAKDVVVNTTPQGGQSSIESCNINSSSFNEVKWIVTLRKATKALKSILEGNCGNKVD